MLGPTGSKRIDTLVRDLVEVSEAPDWLATVNPSFVWSSEGRERGHPLVVDGTLTARGALV